MDKLFGMLALAGALALTACGGPRMSVDPAWKEKPTSYTVVMGEPYVENQDDVTDDFPEYVSNFAGWLAPQLQAELEHQSKVRPELKVVADENFKKAVLPLGDDAVLVHIPNPEKIAGLQGIVVAVHPIRFRREQGACPQGGCLNNKHLVAIAAYSFVNVDEKRVLGYGFLAANDNFSFVMTRSNWENVVSEMAGEIITGTPLK